MFPSFNHSSEEYFHINPSTPNQQHLHNRPTIKRQLIVDHVEDDEKKTKRMQHREIERKRRQDMANLCLSLRSLLPLHFIKGSRSMPEHMNQAVNYIKHLEQNIKGLNTKRDELKKTCRVSDSTFDINSERMVDYSQNPITVKVSGSYGGIEILMIKSCIENKGFPISRVVEALVHEGLDVISCNSTKLNEKLIHSILSEVIDATTCIQVSMLQQKLTHLVHTAS